MAEARQGSRNFSTTVVVNNTGINLRERVQIQSGIKRRDEKVKPTNPQHKQKTYLQVAAQ